MLIMAPGPCTQICQQRGQSCRAAAAGARPRGKAGGLWGHVHARAGREGWAAGGGRCPWRRQGDTLPCESPNGYPNLDALQYAGRLIGAQVAAEPGN